jgi:Flp pilus assembly protein TadG
MQSGGIENHRHGRAASATLRRLASNDAGAAALEFAIVGPVFLLLGVGMIAYAIYFGASHSLQQLAADAARTSIAGLSSGERNALVSTFLDNNAGAYPFIIRHSLTYAVEPRANDPNEYSVTLKYDASNLPIWDLYVPLPLPSRTITYSSVIRLGGL